MTSAIVATGNPNALGCEAVSELTGCTYRQLLYWVDHWVITPSVQLGRGSGTAHVWSERDVEILRVLKQLRDLGAGVDVLRTVSGHLGLLEGRPLPSFIVVGPRGQTSGAAAHEVGHLVARWGACWVLDLRQKEVRTSA
jgi:hypothetical protein